MCCPVEQSNGICRASRGIYLTHSPIAKRNAVETELVMLQGICQTEEQDIDARAGRFATKGSMRLFGSCRPRQPVDLDRRPASPPERLRA